MNGIRVMPINILALASTMQVQRNRLQSQISAVRNAANSLPPEILAMSNIRSRFTSVINNLNRQAETLSRLERATRQVLDELMGVDRHGVQRAKNINFLMREALLTAARAAQSRTGVGGGSLSLAMMMKMERVADMAQRRSVGTLANPFFHNPELMNPVRSLGGVNLTKLMQRTAVRMETPPSASGGGGMFGVLHDRINSMSGTAQSMLAISLGGTAASIKVDNITNLARQNPQAMQQLLAANANRNANLQPNPFPADSLQHRIFEMGQNSGDTVDVRQMFQSSRDNRIDRFINGAWGGVTNTFGFVADNTPLNELSDVLSLLSYSFTSYNPISPLLNIHNYGLLEGLGRTVATSLPGIKHVYIFDTAGNLTNSLMPGFYNTLASGAEFLGLDGTASVLRGAADDAQQFGFWGNIEITLGRSRDFDDPNSIGFGEFLLDFGHNTLDTLRFWR